MKQGLIYARVSTDEQAKEGQSIESQINLCKKFAQENNIKIKEVFKDEGKTATNTKRPGLQNMLEKATDNKNLDCILVLDTDRLARNTLDHLSIKSLLRKHTVDVISISQPMIDDSPEGRFIDVVLAGANALQSQITGRKTSKVMEEKAKAGWWPGRAPIGYENTNNPNPTNSFDKRIVVPDKKRAPLIKSMFEYYLTNKYSIEELCEKMTSLGLKSRQGKPMYVSLTHNILKNPFYYGALPWKDKIYPGKHKPLISKEKWEQIQQIMAQHNQHASRKRKHNYLLRGFLYCADCGSRFWAAPHKGRNKYIHYYYCKECTKGTYNQVKKLENKVGKWIGLIEVSPEYAKELKKEAEKIVKEVRKTKNEEKKALTNRNKAIEEKMETAEDRLIDGTLNQKQFKRIYNRLEEDLYKIKEAIQQMDNKYEDHMSSVLSLVNMAVNFKDTYKNATEEEKRRYLGIFFDKILISKDKITDIQLTDMVKPYFKNGKLSVRVDSNWLPRLDSNQRPSA